MCNIFGPKILLTTDNRLISSVVKHNAIGRGGFGFDCRAGHSQCRQRLATAVTFLRSCAKPWRWTLSLVTRFDVISRV